ncbi:MAG: energy transducer TonB [Candidatus Binatia bacterium]
MKGSSLTQPLLASSLIHLVAILIASTAMSRSARLLHKDFLPIALVDLPRAAKQTTIEKKEQKPAFVKKSPPPKVKKAREPKPLAKNNLLESPRPASPPVLVQPKEELEKPLEAKTPEQTPAFSSTAKVEGGRSAAGAGNLFGNGDIAVVPRSGTAGGGAGTASSGLGRGSGAPGLPAPTTILRTNRAAKPLQTVKASYPPMALRMGMEGDVALRIEVDTEGKVMTAEVVKSGGTGFDEEALKAVKQSRFEPAQKDGHNVRAEFTYIYRFRLAK